MFPPPTPLTTTTILTISDLRAANHFHPSSWADILTALRDHVAFLETAVEVGTVCRPQPPSTSRDRLGGGVGGVSGRAGKWKTGTVGDVRGTDTRTRETRGEKGKRDGVKG